MQFRFFIRTAFFFPSLPDSRFVSQSRHWRKCTLPCPESSEIDPLLLFCPVVIWKFGPDINLALCGELSNLTWSKSLQNCVNFSEPKLKLVPPIAKIEPCWAMVIFRSYENETYEWPPSVCLLVGRVLLHRSHNFATLWP